MLLEAIVHHTYGAALRSNAGDEPSRRSMLDKAIGLLVEAKAIFRRYHHERHVMRASRELVIAYIYAGNQGDAERNCQDIEELARNARWQCEALLCRSRVIRHFAPKGTGESERTRELAQAERARALVDAEDAAAKALKLAEKAALEVFEVEARIQRGCARLERTDPDDRKAREHWGQAQRDFEAAIRKTDSPRHQGVANLYLARCLVKLGQPDAARRPLELGETLTSTFEFPVIRKLARQANDEFKQSQRRFVLEVDPDKYGLDYEYYENELRQGLVKLALARSSNVRLKAAKELHVTRATLSSWIDNPGPKKDGRKRKSSSPRRPSSPAEEA